ncbi:16S rRNA (cytidine(1402)-2'-O)-methyltransferase [Ilumatobacter nonamiensis]|uniref:16S rRNA (cytidine(1402)-2'-O)-methyltransferase n=1 Tax=Ilumatobacter nonamiensis TaxID=467093 RepID=UPI000345879D|nr:16S rRNA (cytidine(1402)-2'-O)-methyltransferase [Ilumatobacter nonamiensis]
MSTLWLVATPIGNLGDLAPRAIEVLSTAELVCCEDTRRTGKLLQHAGIRAKRLAVCNEHTEFDLVAQVLDTLGSGGDVAVVSDAGSPGISDPGELLVAAAVTAGHDVSAVPGPTAATMAVTISGLPSGRHVYEGFLPRKGRERSERIDAIATEHRTVVLYEAPHRVQRTLAELTAACGADRPVSISRELTKLHEETIRGTLGTVDLGEPRGEYVIVVGGAATAVVDASDDHVRRELRNALAGGASTRDAVAKITAATGRRKREVYQLALEQETNVSPAVDTTDSE